jgi:FlaA1/EpsC-like NDP-sugar epimerase
MKAKPKRYSFIAISMIIDVIIYTTAYIAALSIRAVAASSIIESNFPFVIASSLFLILTFSLFGIYRRIWSQTSGHDIIYIIGATGVVFVATLAANLITVPRPIPLSIFFVSYVLAFTGFVVIRYRSRLIGAFRWRYRAVLHREFPKSDIERVLIIGAGESGQNTALQFRRHSYDNHYKVIGFLDDDREKIGMLIENCKILGTTEQIPAVVKAHDVDLIVVAIHNIDGERFRRILSHCELTKARIKVVPNVLRSFDTITDAPPLRDVTPEDLIGRSIVAKHKDVDLSPISNRVVLVTGAAGSIGSEIAQQILDYDPTELILLDNNESALHDLHITLEASHPNIDIMPFLVDISQYDRLQHVYQQHKPEIVFHAAAYKHVPMLERYPNEAVRVNIGGTLNAVELALLNNVKQFVLISTDKAVDPISVMGASKRICELIIHAVAQNHAYSTQFATVRFGNVLGSRGSVVPTFNHQIDQGGPVTVTHRDMTRYFMSIPEATNLVLHAAAMTTGDDVFVLRMGEVIKIVDLAERMIRLRGLRPYVDIQINFTGIRRGEKMHEELYELDENPQSTKHPFITKTSSSHLNGHTMDFMGRIRSLVRDGVQDDNQALDELRQLIEVVATTN